MARPAFEKDFISFSFPSIRMDKNNKKKYTPPTGWSDFTESQPRNSRHKGLAYQCGARSGILIIDCDDMETYWRLVKFVPEEEENSVKTFRGVHMYFKYNPDKIPVYDKSLKKIDDNPNIDIQADGKMVIAPTTSYSPHEGGEFIYKWYKSQEQLFEIPDDLFNEINSYKPEPKPKPESKKSNETDKHSKTTLKKLLDIIDVKYITDRDTWLKLVYAMNYEEFSFQDILKFSQISPKYKDIITIEEIESICFGAWENEDEKKLCKGGTIYHYAYLSDDIATSIATLNMQNLLQWTDYNLAKLYLKLNKKDVFYVENENTFFIWNDLKWNRVNLKQTSYLKTHVVKTLLKLYNDVLTKAFDDVKNTDPSDEEQYKKAKDNLNDCRVIINKLQTFKDLQGVIEFIKDQCISYPHNIKFDDKPDIIYFNNCKFNLITGEKSDIDKEDYITQTTGYDYKESTTEQKQEIKDLFNKIFVNEEYRKCYISILINCLKGGNKNKIINAQGLGGNGKSLLNELMWYLLGKDEGYAYRANPAVLQQQLAAQGASPEIANFHNKRMIVFPEPSASKPICVATCKQFADNATISARGLYQSKTEIALVATIILELNQDAKFDARPDDGLARRYNKIVFNSLFVDTQKKFDKAKADGYDVFWANQEFKSNEWRDNNKIHLFNFLMDNLKELGELYFPDIVVKDSETLIEDNKTFERFFEDEYERKVDSAADAMNSTWFIKLKDVWEKYKKETGDKMTYCEFRRTYINLNPTFKNYYLETYRPYEGGKQKKYLNVLRGYGEKDKLIDDSDDDED
jgi:phage/plasmid-associated DNA primase